MWRAPAALVAFLAASAAANCKDSGGKVVRTGASTRDDAFVYTCVEETRGDFYLKTTGCIYDGVVLRKGEPIMDDYYVYECVESRGSMGIETTACVDTRGNAVKKGAMVRRDGYVFACEPDRYGALRLKPFGCVKDGRSVAIGKTFSEDRFWYKCTERNGQPMKELGGCVSDDGARVNPGGTYLSDSFAITCHCRSKNSRCTNRVAGCAEDLPNGGGRRRYVGDTWLQGVAPFRYRVTCKTCSLGITIVRTNTRCRYGNDLFIEPGCMKRKSGGDLVACGINYLSGLQVSERRYSAAALTEFRANKFKFC